VTSEKRWGLRCPVPWQKLWRVFLGFIHGRAHPWGVVRNSRTRSDTQLNSKYIKPFLKNRIWTKFWNTIPFFIRYLHWPLVLMVRWSQNPSFLRGFLPCSIVPKQVLNQSTSIQAIRGIFLLQRAIKKYPFLSFMGIILVSASWTQIWIFRRMEKKVPYPVPDFNCHIFSFSLIIFWTSCSVMGLRYSSIQYCFDRVGSWIHLLDQVPQYEYWPSNFIRDAELKANRPGDMKYCVFVCIMNQHSLMDTQVCWNN